MRRKIIFLLVIFSAAWYQICFAQNQHKIDSLLSVLKIAKEDTHKVITLIALGDGLIKLSDFEPAKKHADDALRLSEKLNYHKGISDALLFLGSIHWNQGDLEGALDNFKRSLIIKENIGDKKGIAKVYGNMGLVYLNQGNYTDAMEHNLTALKIKREINDRDLGATLFNLANVHLTQGDFPPALKYLYEALEAFEGTGDKRGIAFVYMNIGRVNHVQNNLREAIKNVEAGLHIARGVGNRKIEVACHNNLAIIYSDLDSLDESLKHYSQALDIAKAIGAKQEIAIAYGNMGAIYFMQGEYDKALRTYMDALPVAEKSGNKENVANIYTNIGKSYLIKKMYSDAGTYLVKGYSLATELGVKQIIKESLEGLTELEEKRNNFKQSLYYQRLLTVYKDSLLNESNSLAITEMQTKYETEKKEKEISTLSKDKEIQSIEIKKQKVLKNAFVGGLVMLSLLSIFIFNSFRTRNKLRLQAIRNRIADDLHDDIGSTLNSISIYSEVAKQKSPVVVHELEQIGEASRKIIDAMSDIVWTINTKNDSFEQIILRLRSLTYNLLRAKNIEHTFRADENMNSMKLSMEQRRNFYLIFKEALNNIVKYSNASRVSISLTHEHNFILLTIRDNGTGFNVKEKYTGNGLLSMKTRAEEMKADLKIESELGSGTNIELKLKA